MTSTNSISRCRPNVVISGGWMGYLSGADQMADLLPVGIDLAGIVDAATRIDAASVWLMPDAITAEASADPDWWNLPEDRYRSLLRSAGASKAPLTAAIRKIGVYGAEMTVHDLARDTRWAWRSATDLNALLHQMSLLEGTLGVPMGWSPAATGIDLMRLTVRDDWLPARDWDGHIIAKAPMWVNPKLGEIQEGCWLHIYDTNAAYLAAAQSVKLGAGRMIGDHILSYNPPVPPNWLHAPHVLELGGSASPLVRDADPAYRAGNYDVAIYRAARAIGGDPPIQHAWGYEHSHQALRKWAERLRDARYELAQYPERAGYQVVKNIYTQTIGKLDMQPKEGSPNRWHYPTWAAAIISEAARRRYAEYVRLAWDGYLVALLHVDSIGVIVRDPDPASVEIALSDQIGKYRVASSTPITPELNELLGRRRIRDLLSYVDEHGEPR